MKLSRPLQYVLLASVCATIYAAWIDLTGDTAPAPVERQARTAPGRPQHPAPAGPDLAHAATAANIDPTNAVDLFTAPGWRFDTTPAALPAGPDLDAPATPQPQRPAIEVAAIWRDANGVKVVVNHGQATRIACDGCSLPGSWKPGSQWNGYRLETVEATGVSVTELSTGKRLPLEAT